VLLRCSLLPCLALEESSPRIGACLRLLLAILKIAPLGLFLSQLFVGFIVLIDESESQPLPTPVFSSFCSHCSEKRLLRTEGIYVAKECVPAAPCSWPPSSSATTRFAKLTIVPLLPHMSVSVSGFGAAFGAKFVFVTALLPGMVPSQAALFFVLKF